MVGKLLDGTQCQVLLDIGASILFMSKSHYLRCKSLHSLPKFTFKAQRIQVTNGQYISVLFIIPNSDRYTCSQIWNIYISIKIHENVDLVLGIMNIFELEGINSQESCFSFLNRSIPLFPKEQIILRPKEQWFIKTEAPFVDEISGLAIVKMLHK